MDDDVDFLIVGSGIAGLRAAIELARAGRVLILTKAEAAESNTGYAQGGIAAAIGAGDSPDLHAYDTIKGGDFLVDQTAAEVLCREAVECIYDLEHMGLPFDRTPEGRISQRRFGGHTKPNPDFDPAAPKGTPNARPRIPVMRACHSAVNAAPAAGHACGSSASRRASDARHSSLSVSATTPSPLRRRVTTAPWSRPCRRGPR